MQKENKKIVKNTSIEMFCQNISTKSKGFTLVELIIVITILAILGTIAYISFQGYTKDARDSSRMSDIKQIYNGLSIYKTQTEKTLLPDNYINIQSGTTTISYQGYAGAGVLRTLKISGGKDPGTKDYYIYTTDVNTKKAQLMTYMETSDKDVQLLGRLKDLKEELTNIKLLNQTYAVTNTGYYQDKKIYVYGDKIGILTNSNKVPLQETTTSTGIDITTLTGNVTTYFGGNVYSGGLSTSTGLTLINQINGAVNNTLPCSPTTYNSYAITSLQDKQAQTFTKTGTISGGTQTGSILATCNNGTLSYGTESFQTSCTGGYSLSGNSCIIVPVLLLHGDNITTSTGFIDSSPSNKTVTRNGDTVQVGGKISGGYLDLDGNGDYIKTNSYPTDFNVYGGDFTIDFWIKTSTTTAGTVFDLNKSGDRYYSIRLYMSSAGTLQPYMTDNGGAPTTFPGTYTTKSINDNQWHHIALVSRNGNNSTLYIDGVSEMTATTSAHIRSLDTLLIGAEQYEYVITPQLNLKVDEFRISKGIARWTTNFTPQTGEYLTDSYTKLLLHFNDSGATFTDDSGSSKGITSYGNATQFVPKFGNGAIYFDGNGDYLSLPTSTDFDLGTGDFTIDTWVNFTSVTGAAGTNNTILELYAGSTSIPYMQIYETYTGQWALDLQGGVGGLFGSPNANQWYHLALVRKNGTDYFFIDGSQVWSSADSHNYLSFSTITIGYSIQAGGSRYMKGYMDELRVVKGVAARTSNFTPPTSPY